MTTELFSDNAATTLTSSPTSGATSFTVASSTGFPAAVTGTSQFRVIIGTEIITVTNVAGTTWTCVATSAAHTSADVVTHVLTAASLGNFVDGKVATQAAIDSSTYAPVAAPTFTGSGVKAAGVAIGNALKGQKRTPFFANVTIDGSTLANGATDGTDKIAQANICTFTGGFSGEGALGGVVNPGFILGANDFVVTGTTTGDIAGITNMWGRLTEVHLYTPSAAITNLFGIAGQSNIEASATGASVTSWMASVYASAPKNVAGATVANAAALYVVAPAAGVATAQYAIYQGGTTAPNFFGARSTFNAGMDVGGGVSGFRVLTSATAPNIQAAAAGVYAGFNSALPGIELADGTTNWHLDNNGGVLRFMKAGVQQQAALDMATGHFSLRGSPGFNGATPVTKQAIAGSRGGNAALASLLTALAATGLLTDSSTA